jgi:hypothetical protein
MSKSKMALSSRSQKEGLLFCTYGFWEVLMIVGSTISSVAPTMASRKTDLAFESRTFTISINV